MAFHRQREKSEFDHKLIDLARVARVVAGGKRFRFRAAIVMGNRKGKVGFGLAKGNDVADAMSKSTAKAKKNMVDVIIINDTIPYEIKGKQDAADVLLKPAKAGTGIIAGGAVRTVCELAGIKNILSKMKGSNNKINNALATISALKELKKPEEIALARSKKLEDILPRTTPKTSPIKTQGTEKAKVAVKEEKGEEKKAAVKK